MKKDLTAFIFARGGSKGIKDKNIRKVGGKSLIAYSIECGLNSKYINRIIVSTDSNKIAEIAEQHGAEILMRPAELAQDDTPEIEAWRHAINARNDIFTNEHNDIFISLPATSPMRAQEDVDAAVERYFKKDCEIVFGISPSHRNPYLNMATIGPDDLIYVTIEGSNAMRRQDVPDVYDITTCVYVTTPHFIKTCARLIDGRVGYVIIPAERALDVDTEFDLYLADLMLKNPFKKQEQ